MKVTTANGGGLHLDNEVLKVAYTNPAATNPLQMPYGCLIFSIGRMPKPCKNA